MTLPYEQYHAINNTRNFLLSLMDSKQTKVPLSIRKRARELLKHYPMECEANDMVRHMVERIDDFDHKRVVRMTDHHVEYSPRHGGWIFWDETWMNPSRAYLTRQAAEQAMTEYADSLHGESQSMVVSSVRYMEDPDGPTGA